MHFIIHHYLGRVHHAAGHPDLTVTRPVFAFVPEQFFGPEGFRRRDYLASLWPNLNCAANPLALGSRVLPDPTRPVSIHSRCPVLREFLTQIAGIVPAKTAA